jgi:hypothetical protein
MAMSRKAGRPKTKPITAISRIVLVPKELAARIRS